MKFEKLGKEKENVTVRTEPFNFSESNILKHYNNTFGYINEHKPSKLEEYIRKLTEKLLAVTKQEFFHDINGKLSEILQQYKHLTDQSNIMRLLLSNFISTLGVTEEQYWENKEQEFPDWNFFHSIRDIHLMDIKSLIDVFGKEEGIDLYKKIADEYVIKYNPNQKNWYIDLEEMRFHHMKFIENNSLGRVRLMSNVEDGRYVEICLTCDKMKNYLDASQEDRELLDVTGCYCHEGLVRLWNENFILTLNKTIAKGDPYCTYVYHDTRVVDTIKVPSQKFFDEVIEEFSEVK
ncbi:MAG TPA: hypothetical protein VMZ29_01240 [Candidatus Bathyarchaeia archaeon]|nr:hypothetical protein [Candidatus Bathyarchaeia archaeon]